jgi:NAD(P)-dependent dehydrogenase (short-subunit alcohol dehydrogenase family)
MARTVIITGGAGGLGLAMARGLLADGHRIALVDSDAAAIERSKEVLGNNGGDLLAVVGDVSVETTCRSVAETVGEAFGPVEVLINNAGIGPSSLRPDAERRLPSVTELTPEIWSRFFANNVTGAYLMLREVLPQMRDSGWGRIINNTTSFFTMLRVLPYGATKAALEAASAVWAKELEGTGVTVNVVVPGGPTDTAFIADQSGIDRDKMLQPDVMVAPVRWLASKRSDDVTGRRFIAARWESDIPAHEAAEKSGAPIGWPDLAAATVVWPDD